MKSVDLKRMTCGALAAGFVAMAGVALAEPSHGISMYGEPALPADFTHLPYANPDAPKGGRIVIGEGGSFDSLNPHIGKGRVPWMLRIYGYESLMGRNWDEPFTLYGLLAETIETGPNREWVEFVIRPEAKFADGSPVTVEDVIWSHEILGAEGSHGRYASTYAQVEKVEKTGDRTVRFTFNSDNRELALVIGLRPIMKKAQWDGVDFAQSGLDVNPITTAAYQIDDFEAGRFMSLKRNPDYWGNDLPLRKGLGNLDEIRFDYYADGSAMFEAFKAGEFNTFREGNTAKWDTQYDFERVTNGEVVKSVIPHKRPSGITGFAMNTRLPQFADWRVRQAMIEAFNYEFINDKINGGSRSRITSYFSNSVLAMNDGPATDEVKALLEPFAADLTPDAFDDYDLPISNGNARDRTQLRAALDFLEQAGWNVEDGKLVNADGEQFAFELILKIGANEHQTITDIYVPVLEQLGMDVTVTTLDDAQYRERTDAFDFGMSYYRRSLSLSPGNELTGYWGGDSANTNGSRNAMGVTSPAVDAMIGEILTAETQDGFKDAARALDRVMTTGRYVIPFWFDDVARIAHVKELQKPDYYPMYGDYVFYQPDVWWYEED